MGGGNQTYVIEFILLGLSEDPKIQILLFCVFMSASTRAREEKLRQGIGFLWGSFELTTHPVS